MFFVNSLEAIREAARELGYVVALRGGAFRILNLVAVPWVDQVEAPELLMAAVCEITGAVATGRGAAQQPHGRLHWSLCLPEGSCLDLSVLPRNDRNSLAKQLRADLARLTNEQRLELLAAFCQHCGTPRAVVGSSCPCWNDE